MPKIRLFDPEQVQADIATEAQMARRREMAKALRDDRSRMPIQAPSQVAAGIAKTAVSGLLDMKADADERRRRGAAAGFMAETLPENAFSNMTPEQFQRAAALDPEFGRAMWARAQDEASKRQAMAASRAAALQDYEAKKRIDQRYAGVDSPTVQKLKLSDGSEIAVQWNGRTGQWDPINAPSGGRDITPRTKLTEQQSKLTLFKSMQDETAPILVDLEKEWNPANVPDAIARSTPIAGNFFQSERGQMYYSAAAAWSEGALRIATGAAATQPEIERTIKTYFAQPGDTPNTVMFKAQMREMYTRSVQRGLGAQGVEGSLPTPSEFLDQMERQQENERARSTTAPPQPGTIETDGSGVKWRFKGGNAGDPNSWERAQ